MYSDVLIVGSGHGGAQAAIALRQQRFAGSITIVGNEVDYPYERPPLSKEYFAGDKPFERIMLRPEAFWGERQIAVLLAHTVVAINPAEHSVRLESGEDLGYGQLVWAAGGSARRLACNGGHLARVHSVRSRSDVD